MELFTASAGGHHQPCHTSPATGGVDQRTSAPCVRDHQTALSSAGHSLELAAKEYLEQNIKYYLANAQERAGSYRLNGQPAICGHEQMNGAKITVSPGPPSTSISASSSSPGSTGCPLRANPSASVSASTQSGSSPGSAAIALNFIARYELTIYYMSCYIWAGLEMVGCVSSLLIKMNFPTTCVRWGKVSTHGQNGLYNWVRFLYGRHPHPLSLPVLNECG